jgi:hypothetical protein
MRISQIAIVALGVAMIGGCGGKPPAEDSNIENAPSNMDAADMNATDMNYVETIQPEPQTSSPQTSPSDSDVTVDQVKPQKGRPNR